jgi:hypothetical protein
MLRLRTLFCFSLLAGTLLLNGCGTTLVLEPKSQLARFDGGPQVVYVTNPQMQPEYDILKASKIYQLTNQPAHAFQLTLHPMGHGWRCGNPLLLTFYTAGLIPGYLPAARTFEYDLSTNGIPVTYIHSLPLYERYSDWEWLVPRSDKRALAQGLRWSARQQKLPNVIY